jgi:hypothetical protein
MDEAKYDKSAVNYRPAKAAGSGELQRKCGNCTHFSNGTCAVVKGAVKPSDVCNRWMAKR